MAVKPPVFIIGSPRSGTTFLRNVLNRQPSLAICDETRFFADIYRRRYLFGSLENTNFGSLENTNNRQRLVEEYLSTARVRRFGVDLRGLKEKLLCQATSNPLCLPAFWSITPSRKERSAPVKKLLITRFTLKHCASGTRARRSFTWCAIRVTSWRRYSACNGLPKAL